MILPSIAFLNAVDNGLFVGIYAWLGFIILFISLTLYSEPIITSDDDLIIQVDQTQLKSRLFKIFYVFTTIALCIVNSFMFGYIEIGEYTIRYTNPLYILIHLTITILYVKSIGRSGWYGLLGLLGIFSLFFILRLKPNEKEIVEPNLNST